MRVKVYEWFLSNGFMGYLWRNKYGRTIISGSIGVLIGFPCFHLSNYVIHDLEDKVGLENCMMNSEDVEKIKEYKIKRFASGALGVLGTGFVIWGTYMGGVYNGVIRRSTNE